ncbi:MAG: DUF933 domain-containing protein [Armatimonadetes bacterium]|nr:DUF933 domain-containing protein [Armatimonadota bacterium]
MKIPILGLPLSGKTTLFRVLAAGHLPDGGGHLAAVPVADPRLDLIAEREQPRKKTYASVTFVDVAAMRAEEDKSARVDKLHDLVGDADALLLVVQAFGEFDHQGRPLDPRRDLRDLVAELVLTDLAIIETRGERVAREHRARRRGEADPEWELLERVRAALEDQRWARELSYNDEDLRILRGYGLLTMRPAMVAFNCAEEDVTGERCAEAAELAQELGLPAQVIAAELELELAELPEEDQAAFLAEYGLEQPARDRVLRAAYDLLDAVTFFTVNAKEARAWTIPRGTTARQAAGKIHTDMEKGFVRAEVVSFEDYQAVGDLAAARSAGKVRLEGQDYVVQDGDLIEVRFTR